MKVPIEKIKVSPFATRPTPLEVTSLAKSMKEYGQLQPIKIRPLPELGAEPCRWHGWEWIGADMDTVDRLGDCPGCDALHEAIWGDGSTDYPEDFEYRPKWECIFGTRRLVAAQEAELTEIEVVIQKLDDREARLQIWEENEEREDLDALSKARFLKAYQGDYGLSIAALAREFGYATDSHVHNLFALLDEPRPIQEVVLSMESTERAVRTARRAFPEDEESRIKLVQEAAKEGFGSLTIERRAREMKAEKYAERKADEYIESQEFYESIPKVASLLQGIKDFRKVLEGFSDAFAVEKLSPEAETFVARRLRRIGQDIIALADEMEE